jgi:hypothetical protein
MHNQCGASLPGGSESREPLQLGRESLVVVKRFGFGQSMHGGDGSLAFRDRVGGEILLSL